MKRRLFVAVEFEPQFLNVLSDVVAQLREQGVKGRYERVGNLHVTLAFIGETDRLEDIKCAMSEVAVTPFDIAPGKFGLFPKHGVLWLGLTNEPALKALAKAVRAKLDEIGITYSTKEFVPHITLVKDAAFDDNLEIDILPGKMTVKKISVMETTYENGHRKYVER